MFLGIHCSVRQGYLAALQEAQALGVEAMQILPYPRHHTPGDEEFAAFRQAYARSGLKRLLIHSRYLPALSVSDAALRARSVTHLLTELTYAEKLGGDAFVLHMGAFSPGSSFEQGLDYFVSGLQEARSAGRRIPLYIENVPGGGRRMGGTRSELERILAAARQVWPETYLCLDTAHGWAAGDDLSAYDPPDVRAWHINDTLAETGTHVESHWHLGQGRLGDALGQLLKRLGPTETTVILETPKEPGADEKNLAWARRALQL